MAGFEGFGKGGKTARRGAGEQALPYACRATAAARRMRGEGQDFTHVSVGRGGKLKRPAQFNSFVRRYMCHTTHETYHKTYGQVPAAKVR